MKGGTVTLVLLFVLDWKAATFFSNELCNEKLSMLKFGVFLEDVASKLEEVVYFLKFQSLEFWAVVDKTCNECTNKVLVKEASALVSTSIKSEAILIRLEFHSNDVTLPL